MKRPPPTAAGPLIHIGYHKTGTSWLQKQLFRKQQGFAWGGKGTDSPVNRIVTVSALDFDGGEAREDFAAEIELAERRRLRHVVSLERLSGHPFSGGYDSAEIARRLHATFPDGRVLVVIREQRSVIASTYMQYVEAGGALPLRLFLEPPVYRRPRTAAFDLRHFEYDRLLRLYVGLFGPKRVLAVPYEWLRDDPPGFAARIRAFAGVEAAPLEDAQHEAINVSRGAVATGTARIVNRLFVRSDVNPLPIVASPRLARAANGLARGVTRLAPQVVHQRRERRLRSIVAEVAGARYAASNRRWSQTTGIDLGALGYDVGSERAEDEAIAH